MRCRLTTLLYKQTLRPEDLGSTSAAMQRYHEQQQITMAMGRDPSQRPKPNDRSLYTPYMYNSSTYKQANRITEAQLYQVLDAVYAKHALNARSRAQITAGAAESQDLAMKIEGAPSTEALATQFEVDEQSMENLLKHIRRPIVIKVIDDTNISL
jgi:hypothetical protein